MVEPYGSGSELDVVVSVPTAESLTCEKTPGVAHPCSSSMSAKEERSSVNRKFVLVWAPYQE